MNDEIPAKRTLAILGRMLGALLRRPAPRTFPALRAENLPALAGKLEIVRDANGIAHVYADEEADLYAALGYLQAADRLVFVDVIRHLGAGRLCQLIGNFAAPGGSEFLGARRIGDVDAFVRPLGFERQSEVDAGRLAPRAARCLASFADGFNAALRAMRGAYPPEYALLSGVRPWTPADCLLAADTCAFAISITLLENELTFDAARRHLGDDGARRLYPEAPWHIVPTSYSPRDTQGPDALDVPLHVRSGGSNNWAVGPSRSGSGAPIVANDPHVPLLPLPTFWHHVHVECPEYRIQGGLLPGCPAFVLGHNGHLAWGVTHAGRDTYDLYRIHRLPGDSSRYRTVAGESAIEKHREELEPRRGPKVVVEWESCEHGILYSGWKHHDGVDLALRVIPGDLARFFEGYLDLAASRTDDEHQRALASIHEGPFDFNHVYGHVDGTIGWRLFGRVPRRKDGLFFRDAHDPEGQWDGFVPFDEMPRLRSPESGFVATANSTVIADADPVAFTAVHCEPRHRQRQIEDALGSNGTHSHESFAALQARVDADYGPPVRDALLAILGESLPAAESLAGRAARLLAAWDGRFASDQSAPTIFFHAQQGLAHRLFGVILGAELAFRYANGPRAIPRLQRLLLDRGDPLRADIESAAGMPFARIVREAFSAATAKIAARHGGVPEDWHWGRVYRVRLGTIVSLLPLVGRPFLALDEPYYGDDHTVSRSHPVEIGRHLYAVVGASSRFICDLSKPEEALFAHSSGPSADPRTTFFSNLSAAWHRCEYFRSALWRPDEVQNPVERMVANAGGSRGN